MNMEFVVTPGTPITPPILGSRDVHLALHAIHMDYIMRVHCTNWYGPTADHPGGWCQCFRGDALPEDSAAPDEAGPAAPATGRKRQRKQKKVRPH